MPQQTKPYKNIQMPVINRHYVLDHPIQPPFPAHLQQAVFGMGCFWGAEKMFWNASGVWSTAVGYSGGETLHPRYKEVCSGQTGHNEVVWVVYNPEEITYSALLTLFWEGHNPTQGMRQGNDCGSQYRSMIQYFTPEQKQQAEASLQAYQTQLHQHGLPDITSEIIEQRLFYYAENDHQQYLAKNPQGYCGLGGIGISQSETGL